MQRSRWRRIPHAVTINATPPLRHGAIAAAADYARAMFTSYGEQRDYASDAHTMLLFCFAPGSVICTCHERMIF